METDAGTEKQRQARARMHAHTHVHVRGGREGEMNRTKTSRQKNRETIKGEMAV